MAEPEKISFKVGLVGDAQIGKTSLMYRYVKNDFDSDYILTLGLSSTFSFKIFVFFAYCRS